MHSCLDGEKATLFNTKDERYGYDLGFDAHKKMDHAIIYDMSQFGWELDGIDERYQGYKENVERYNNYLKENHSNQPPERIESIEEYRKKRIKLPVVVFRAG